MARGVSAPQPPTVQVSLYSLAPAHPYSGASNASSGSHSAICRKALQAVSRALDPGDHCAAKASNASNLRQSPHQGATHPPCETLEYSTKGPAMRRGKPAAQPCIHRAPWSAHETVLLACPGCYTSFIQDSLLQDIQSPRSARPLPSACSLSADELTAYFPARSETSRWWWSASSGSKHVWLLGDHALLYTGILSYGSIAPGPRTAPGT